MPASNILANNRRNAGPMITIDILIDAGISSPVSEDAIRQAVAAAAARVGFKRGDIGIRIADDAAIHEINRRHLAHDYPTDVISFTYQSAPPTISGELIVSAETARRQARRYGWPVAHEMLLYVVHGVLHIAGLDDQTNHQRSIMRAAERAVLKQFGIDPVPHPRQKTPASGIAEWPL